MEQGRLSVSLPFRLLTPGVATSGPPCKEVELPHAPYEGQRSGRFRQDRLARCRLKRLLCAFTLLTSYEMPLYQLTSSEPIRCGLSS